MTPREAERQTELLLQLHDILTHPEETALLLRRYGNFFSYSLKILMGREPAEKCQLCYATDGPLLPYDPGEGNTIRLCPACVSCMWKLAKENAKGQQPSGPVG